MHHRHTQQASESGCARARAARCERLWVGLALMTLVGVGEAAAGEAMRLPPGSETLIGRDPPASDLSSSPVSAPPVGGADEHADRPSERAPVRALPYSSITLSPLRMGSMSEGPASLGSVGRKDDPFGLQDFTLQELEPREFRPRPHSLNEADGALTADDSLIDDRDTWQRLASDYRAQRRVRVVTLWDAGWSSISLQAGKHGDPYLQWTGHLFGRSEAHRGVLDRWMPRFSAGSGAERGIAHALTAPLATRPLSSIASHLNTPP